MGVKESKDGGSEEREVESKRGERSSEMKGRGSEMELTGVRGDSRRKWSEWEARGSKSEGSSEWKVNERERVMERYSGRGKREDRV